MKELPLDIESLFGIVTCPDKNMLPGTAVLILNSGLIHRVGPFRLAVMLARRLASEGVLALRVDQSGKGDSSRRAMAADESVFADFEDFSREMNRSFGVNRFLLVGLCSGADDALRIAERYSQVCGIVLLDGFAPKDSKYYLYRYGPKLFSLPAWKKRLSTLLRSASDSASIDQEAVNLFDFRDWDNENTMVAKMRAMLEREIQMLAVFTSDVDDYYAYEGQLSAGLGISEYLDEVFLAEAKHVYPIRKHRELLIDTIIAWLKPRFFV